MDKSLKFSIEVTLSYLCLLWIWVTIFLPSMKFFVFSPVLNLVCLAFGVAIFVLGYRHFSLNREALFALSILTLFFGCLMLSFWQGYTTPTFEYIFKLINIVFIVVLAVVFSTKINLSHTFLMKVSVLYGLSFSLLSFVGVIKATSSGALSYLNLGLPIGITVVAFYLLFLRESRLILKFFLLLCFAFSFFMVLKTPARGVLLGTVILLVYMSFKYKRKRYLLYISLITTPILITYWEEIYTLSSFVIGKMERLIFSIEKEARYTYYVEVFNYSSDRFWGYGLRSYLPLLGFYPHSLTLEFLIVGGYLLTLLFIVMMLFALVKIYTNIGEKSDLDFIFLITIYFFIQWHLSYELSSAYGFFLCLSIVLSKKSNKQNLA